MRAQPRAHPQYPPGGEEPKINAGSDTFPLDVAAAWSEDRQLLTVGVINPTQSEQKMQLRISGANLAGGTLRRLTHPDLNYAATPGQPSAVKIVEQRLAKMPREVVLPRHSVSLYALKVAN